MPLNKLLNVQEAASLLRISVHTVRSWVSRRRLPYVKLGRRTVFDATELERWIAERSLRERGSPSEQRQEIRREVRG